jgi:uncharacterized protein (TIGR00290 family)
MRAEVNHRKNAMRMRKAAVLWTGGKDSCLALHRAYDKGIAIACLATFVPEDRREFEAHPTAETRRQAHAMNLDLHFISVHEPYRDSYIRGLTWLQGLGITTVITGDINYVEGHPNWIGECCNGLDLEVIRPLWQESRHVLMEELITRGIQARITWINHPSIPLSWKGRVIDTVCLTELKRLSMKAGIDLCGENGEYHTMVDFAPLFGERP